MDTPSTDSRASGGADPAVSVIVPVYNAERYLDQALASAEGQTLRGLEIVCVNDGSTDGSRAILVAHAARDPRVRIVDKPNCGYGSAMNRGIREARGEWIAILEPDDWIEPGMYADMLELAARHADAEPPIDIIETPYWVIVDADKPTERRLPCQYRGRIRPKRQPFTVHDAPHLLAHHPSIWTALYRRSFLDGHKIRFKEVPGAGWVDNPFLVETLCQAEAILYLPRAYYCYRDETPEKTAQMAQRDPLLPFERWNDMVDVLERLGVTDPAVWTPQITRAFTYMGGIVEFTGVSGDPAIEAAVHRMYDRMDPALVFADPRVSPAAKEAFARYRGIAGPPISRLAHIRDLVRETCYNTWNKGLLETLRMARTYLSSYTARSGKERARDR